MINRVRPTFLRIFKNSVFSSYHRYRVGLQIGAQRYMDKSESIWLDCDPGLDDCFAIVLAARHPRLNLIGLSASPGNTSLQNTTRNALDILSALNRQDVPVYKGSKQLIKGELKLAEYMHGSNGLGGVKLPMSPVDPIEENVFEKISQALMGSPEPVIWANTGSLTNLCLLLRDFPQVKSKIKGIVLMGGSTQAGNITPAAQFNIYFDPNAFEQVLKTKGDIPLTMVPLDLTSQVVSKDDVFEFLFKFKQLPLAQALHTMLRQYQQMYNKAYGFQFPIIHDPCVLYYILFPEEIGCKKAKIEVDIYPISYGRTNCYFTDHKNPSVKIESIDQVALTINSVPHFWGVVLQVLETVFNSKK